MSTMKRRNRISGQFAARLIEMLESPAYRALSGSAHKVISRIEIELGHHGGNDNGRLPVTTNDFVEYGMHRTSVAPAIREAEALGFIRVTERGRGGNAEKVLQKFKQKTLIMGIDSDILCPLHEQELLAKNILNSTLIKIDSLYGHDGFITEATQISKALAEWI